MTLHLRPDVAAGLETLASAQGLSVEVYLEHLVQRELPTHGVDAEPSKGTGMVVENGLFVYRTGNPLPAHVVDDAIRRSREERSRLILGEPS